MDRAAIADRLAADPRIQVDAELAAVKISLMGRAINRIAETLPVSLDAFLDDSDRRDIVTFNLFVAIRECIALATHVVADAGWSVPRSHGDTLEQLAEKKIIDREPGRQLRRAAGLRNLIAHQYGGVDRALIDGFARDRRADRDWFCQHVAELVPV